MTAWLLVGSALAALLVLIRLQARLTSDPLRWVAKIEVFDPQTGATVMTLAIPSNGVTKLGVRYFDQFNNPLAPQGSYSAIVVPSDNDPATRLVDMAINETGDELSITGHGLGVTGAASLAVLAQGNVESPRVFLTVQDPVLSRAVVDESSARFEPLPA